MLALSIACTAAAAVWAYLVLGHGGYWRTGQRLPPPAAGAADGTAWPDGTAGPDVAAWPDVAAVIPGRNEAAMLPVGLAAVRGQGAVARYRDAHGTDRVVRHALQDYGIELT